MSTVEFITALFSEVDEQLRAIPTHPEAHLWPSEVVTLGLLHALKGVGNRPFYRWLTRDYRPLFPRLPERTRLFRLFTTHHAWTQAFLAAPTVLGVIVMSNKSTSWKSLKAWQETDYPISPFLALPCLWHKILPYKGFVSRQPLRA